MRAIRVPRYGSVFSVGPAPSTIKLAEEVDGYFELGVSVPAGGLVVDVGANIGMFALAAAARSRGVRFVGIEPVPAIFDALVTNFRRHPLLDHSDARLLRAAIGRERGGAPLRLSYFSRFPSDTTGYLDEKRAELERVFAVEGDKLGAAVERRIGGSIGRAAGALCACAVGGLPRGRVGRFMSDRVMGRTEVEAMRIPLRDALRTAGPIDLLKIDVEGAELDVLESLDDETWSRVRRVVLESNDRHGAAALGGLLRARGLTEQRVRVPPRASFGAVGDFLLDAARAG